ncbi:MAG: hypothetical protein KZQ85_14755 [Candidatus Thiodiazotropha sp. (ex Myrtea sp. 'scaly one' KF741663)]|nr:hypothetical protein [Candidatus Thiodiazotropha sp. (ex Myrtea sp. 'scaly one' KF741663)]
MKAEKTKTSAPWSLAAMGDGGKGKGATFCNHAEDSLTGLDRQTTRKIAKKDSAWFARRPGKSYRLRPVHRGELPADRGDNFIIVYQVYPGYRVRAAVKIGGDGWTPPSSDQELEKLYNAVVNQQSIALVNEKIVPIASYMMDGGNA